MLTLLAHRPRASRLGALLIALAVWCTFSGSGVAGTLTLGCIYAIAAAGVDVAAGYGALPNTGQTAFMAVGAYVCTILMSRTGAPFVAALVTAIAATGLIGCVLGAAASRLDQLGFAVITIGFAYLVFTLSQGKLLFSLTNGENGIAVPAGHLFGLGFAEASQAVLGCLIVLALVAALLYVFLWSRSAQRLLATKASSVMASAIGIDVRRTRVIALGISGACGGCAGALLAQCTGFITPESFDPLLSITIFGMAAVGGMGTLVGPILGAFMFEYFERSSGLGSGNTIVLYAAFLLVLMLAPTGLFGLLEFAIALGRKTLARFGVPAPSDRVPAEATPPIETAVRSGRPLELECRNVVVEFGGVRALDDITLLLAPGEARALIGPNGAGKTTLINCLTGVQAVRAGAVYLGGRRLDTRRTFRVRRRGLARTFQHPSLVPELTCTENVGLPIQRKGRHRLHGPALSREEAAIALTAVGIDRRLWSVRAADLSYGDQKLVDIARALVGSPGAILLDEPSAGLNDVDIERVGRTLRSIKSSGSVSLLVISHHLSFIRGLADTATVLDFGRELSAGKLEAVLADDRVIEAFVGGPVVAD